MKSHSTEPSVPFDQFRVVVTFGQTGRRRARGDRVAEGDDDGDRDRHPARPVGTTRVQLSLLGCRVAGPKTPLVAATLRGIARQHAAAPGATAIELRDRGRPDADGRATPGGAGGGGSRRGGRGGPGPP